MNYEKKYKESLVRAKEIHNEHKAQPFNIMAKVFPELAESEDERIRKELIDFVKSRLAGFPQCEKYIVWLEKQGEQKPADNKEKLDVLNFIRKETCCGLAEANNALLKLIKVLKERPLPIMDKPYKLKIEWEN